MTYLANLSKLPQCEVASVNGWQRGEVQSEVPEDKVIVSGQFLCAVWYICGLCLGDREIAT